MPVKLNTTYISSALADKLSHISEYPVNFYRSPDWIRKNQSHQLVGR